MVRLTLFFLVATMFVSVLTGCTPTTSPALTSTTITADTPSPTATSLLPAQTDTPPVSIPTQFELTSSAFEPDQPIPVRHACHGENLSPPLDWTQPPPGTQSLVLIMDDPDAVDVVGYVWDHWLLYNTPADVSSLAEGRPLDAELEDGSLQGQNSFKRLGYGGPCPPGGQTHAYVFTLYALDTILALEPGATKEQILEAIEGHVLAKSELVGTYTSP